MMYLLDVIAIVYDSSDLTVSIPTRIKSRAIMVAIFSSFSDRITFSTSEGSPARRLGSWVFSLSVALCMYFMQTLKYRGN